MLRNVCYHAKPAKTKPEQQQTATVTRVDCGVKAVITDDTFSCGELPFNSSVCALLYSGDNKALDH